MRNPRTSRAGFSLIEVTIAMGITVFALITILALIPTGLGANRASTQLTAATNVLTGIFADLRQTPTAAAIASSSSALNAKSPIYGIDVTQASSTVYLDASGALQNSATNARYKVTVALTPPTTGQRTATSGTITITWPATSASGAGSTSSFIALDRN